ncbi:MAG: hypothetical protein EBS77_00120 [Gammaproteobacteria bacterium]|nr:hypothetical protein [Gammaproteobacteria bacterium]
MRVFIICSVLSFGSPAIAETWQCQHRDPSRDPLTFVVGDQAVNWTHARLGEMDPLELVVNTQAMVTMASRRVNILYSRFFHLDKLSGRMGDVTFRPEFLRKLESSPDQIQPDQVTTVWRCVRQEEGSSPSASR